MGHQKQFYIFDFDGTFIDVEAMDLLAEHIAQKHGAANNITEQIADLTQLGMNGQIGFEESLQKRLALLQLHQNDIDSLIPKLQKHVSASFARNKSAIQKYANDIYIISGGFKEYIVPIVTEYGIKPENVYANTLLWQDDGYAKGCDTNNPLSKDNGKSILLNNLAFDGTIHMVGDGYTDYQVKESGAADLFYMFEENVSRPALAAKADYVVQSLDEFLYYNNLERSQSYPKAKINVLLLENIHPKALGILNTEGFKVKTISGALDEQSLCEAIGDVHILGIRSKTEVTERVLQHAKKLMCIGTFCIGTNQVDTKACNAKGIAVFNAPYSNTRSVVELTLGNIIMLMRNVFTKSTQLHNKVWDKSATSSYEIRGKALGIVGYGNIGSQLSVVAEALGMRVYFYDLADKLALGNARRCNSLNELLHKSDIVSLHVDGRAENTNLIGAAQIEEMRDGAILLNLSRGHIVDLQALQNALLSKKIAGAALDVYPYEPKSNDEEFSSPLQGIDNVILTPHIGGSTEEAQSNIGEFVPYKLINYVNKGDTYGSVNLPEVQLPEFTNAHRLLHIHHNVPGILAKINMVFAKYNVNIHAQFLKTNDHIGYVITDVATGYAQEIINEIKNIEGTIRFRSIYN